MPDNVALHYSEAGSGTPVVLLHGFPLSSAIWKEQQQQLSQRYRVITPDLRGHGRSPAPTGPYPMDAMASDVLALLDKLSLKKAVIMGHSMGGYVTLACWRLAQERFQAFGLIASQAGADTDEGRQNRYKLADKVAAEGSKVVADAMLPKLFSSTLPDNSPIVHQVRELMLKTQPVGIIGALQGMAVRPDSTQLFTQITVPILLLAGAQDQIVPAAKAQAMAAAIPGATLAMIDQAGHMPMLEQPQATTSALASFLSGLAA